ncbi:MAG: hypothetical protein DMG35_03940 [Acidobacteria bacterium]|nr:MAG: hypothetical protein DMG35_03940 [Acidobacteriota bacterium]
MRWRLGAEKQKAAAGLPHSKIPQYFPIRIVPDGQFLSRTTFVWNFSAAGAEDLFNQLQVESDPYPVHQDDAHSGYIEVAQASRA